MWFGAGRGADNAVVVLFGSGVGASLVTDDVERGRAVEWGHLTVRVRGRRCRCGALGCLEAYAGAEALLERWEEAGGQPPKRVDEETALTAMLAAAYPADGSPADPMALAVLEETAEYLGAGLSDLINLFQPERILIGGWAGLQLGSRFLPAVREHAVSYALRLPRRAGHHRTRRPRPRRGHGRRGDPPARRLLRTRRTAPGPRTGRHPAPGLARGHGGTRSALTPSGGFTGRVGRYPHQGRPR